MAVTILSQPTTPNVSLTKLVYSISSSNASQPQFQFVTDIYDVASSELLTTLYTYPSSTGSGVIEIGHILNDDLQYDNDWKTTGATVATNSFRAFELHFSESYGTSISSSTTVYSGGLTSSIEVFPGVVEPNLGSFNYQNTSSFHLLSNQSTGSITRGNYITAPVFVPPFSVGGDAYLGIQFISASGDILATNSYNLAGADPVIYQASFGSGSTLFNTAFETTDWDLIRVYNSSSNENFTWIKRADNCNYEGVTFAFINKFGYYDYYSIINPVLKSTNVGRSTYNKVNVGYATGESSYDISRRGKDQYYTTYQDSYQVTTDYVDTATSDWLTELIESPNVYVQENGKFIPVNITNAEYVWRTNIRGQKAFQYTINYQYANQRISR